MIILPLTLALLYSGRAPYADQPVRVETLPLGSMVQDWGSPEKDKSVDSTPLRVAGREYPHGIGTHATSTYVIELSKAATRFTAECGLDDGVSETVGSLVFEVIVDGKVAAKSPVLKKGSTPYSFDVDLKGAQMMVLKALPGGSAVDYDHADWLNPMIFVVDGRSKEIRPRPVPVEPLPQIAHSGGPKTELHGPLVYGCTAGRPFLYLIPCSGDRPIQFSATGLPDGLTLDSTTGIISGSVTEKGRVTATLTAKGPKGKSTRKLTIDSNGLLALTPPLGWNSWNVWAGDVDAAKVKAAADSFTSTGLANYGYSFINIDDTWEAGRDADGNIEANKKFPDMAGLAAYVHSKGLKLGIYSSPGPTTCAGYTASYQHEQQDADSYAKWGIDYLKYDWCSYGGIDPHPDLAGYQKPYAVMRTALDNVDRDIVFSFCQYGMGDVWDWGRKVGGNLWRCTGDINDSWSSLNSIAFGASKWAHGAGPGGWNDPDMLVVGKLGWGGKPRPTKLTPNEQLTHISMWSLLAAPLIIGCDLTQIDRYTFDLLTNPEILDIDQDPMGRPAVRVFQDGDTEVWARPLSDGSFAVGLVNRGEMAQDVTMNLKDFGASGPCVLRNVWIRKDVGRTSSTWSAKVGRHATMVLKVIPVKVQN